jgi:hypothetical protein
LSLPVGLHSQNCPKLCIILCNRNYTLQKGTKHMLVTCLHCQKEFDKQPNAIKRSPNHYCSRSCAAKETNKIPKRKKTKKCSQCDTLILANRNRCSKCYANRIKADERTLGEMVYEKHHKSSAYALVRSQARTVAKQQGWKSCCKCGYDKHIEIAHIKPISDYSPDTKINVINDPKNLMPLCPNCHWEFDHK